MFFSWYKVDRSLRRSRVEADHGGRRRCVSCRLATPNRRKLWHCGMRSWRIRGIVSPTGGLFGVINEPFKLNRLNCARLIRLRADQVSVRLHPRL